MNDMEQTRLNMVKCQIHTWDVLDENILNIFMTVKRENFVPPAYKNIALSDIEIPLPSHGKMLFPRVEARLLQELDLTKKDKVLEIGTGSGYVTAILAKLSAFVYSIEIDETNKKFAMNNLTENGITNVSLTTGDGINGMVAKAPYDKIFIGGALVEIPENLKNQLKIGGKLIGFIGRDPVMHAIIMERISETEFNQKQLFETDIAYLTGEKTEQFNF
ncbi:MAG: protein-L-isoaspartate O-methyltransferase [Burkholderiales bacterium]|jgi:protein-L-isoaspartate(D-aspartate) O-methyltransferase|nr:protein-L-isoaspartate O-methyltransferase [Burkholderiales bacterium]